MSDIRHDVGWVAGYSGDPIPPLGHVGFVGWFDGMKAAVLEPIRERSSLFVVPVALVRTAFRYAVAQQLIEHHKAKAEE